MTFLLCVRSRVRVVLTLVETVDSESQNAMQLMGSDGRDSGQRVSLPQDVNVRLNNEGLIFGPFTYENNEKMKKM